MNKRHGWKAWEPEEGLDPFYVGQDVPGPGPEMRGLIDRWRSEYRKADAKV